MHSLREQAIAIWQAGVDAVKPAPLVRRALVSIAEPLRTAKRILVFGGGKAGSAMSAAVETNLADQLDKIEGIVNVPAESVVPLKKIRLHAARPAGSNQPTAAGVAGALEILKLAKSAGPDDVGLCLISGGGSALSPAPADGITLEDKRAVTELLHACGATITEMNAVRKHLSAIKGGRLAQAFRGKHLYTLIISDVIGDPVDAIASGPTAADPTTFADALAVLDRYDLGKKAPQGVIDHLERGRTGRIPETPKALSANVTNLVVGNNEMALAAAAAKAAEVGFRVVNLGLFQGETRQVAEAMADVVPGIREKHDPMPPPVCLLSGGETTVTLGEEYGKGGRNQEFALASLARLGPDGLREVVILSGGTDGEDGPTDAAGAFVDEEVARNAVRLGLSAADYLARHDAYHFFDRAGGLLRTGLTQTNVMDVRVILISPTTT